MRKVTFYEIGQSQHMIAGDFMEMHSLSGFKDLIALPTGEFGALTQAAIKRERIPISHLRQYGQRDRFIAIAPALAEVLEAPFRDRLEEEKRRVLEFQGRIFAFEKLIRDFTALPWYTRLWRALHKRF